LHDGAGAGADDVLMAVLVFVFVFVYFMFVCFACDFAVAVAYFATTADYMLITCTATITHCRYDHATRIPMVVRGPGIAPGPNAVLGTNVDYAPTWLAMAGIPTPATMDGRSFLTQLIPASAEAELPASTRAQLQADRAALAVKPWRTEQFHQYYNQGGPSPWHPGNCPQTPNSFRPCEGWAPGSSSNPEQAPGDLSQPRFPYDQHLKATIRPLDDYSNTYIGLHSLDPSIGSGHYKYGEFQYACSAEQILSRDCFSAIDMYQLFDLATDPYELRNVYNSTPQAIKDALSSKLRVYYPCAGASCP